MTNDEEGSGPPGVTNEEFGPGPPGVTNWEGGGPPGVPLKPGPPGVPTNPGPPGVPEPGPPGVPPNSLGPPGVPPCIRTDDAGFCTLLFKSVLGLKSRGPGVVMAYFDYFSISRSLNS